MNDQPILTDAALEKMLARRAGPGAPAGLAASIAAAVETLPKARRPWWMTPAPPAGRSQAFRMVWIVAIVGLLLAATASAIYVGSEVLRRTSDLTIVEPTVTPTRSPATTEDPAQGMPPLVLQPVGEPTVSDTVLGTITWQAYQIPAEYGIGGLTGTPYGPVALINNSLRWLNRDGTWEGLKLAWDVSPLTWNGTALLTSGDGLPRRLSWDGSRWAIGDELDVPAAVRPVEQIATGPRGTIVFGEIDFAVAHDGQHFVLTPRPPVSLDPVEPFVLATADGFVALATTDRVPWFTTDGTTWEPAADVSPFGDGAWVSAVAGLGGRFVAVGFVAGSQGPWTAWVSDDGIGWEPIPGLGGQSTWPDIDGYQSIRVTAGDAGWLIYARDGSAWASGDGLTWAPVTDWPEVRGMGWISPEVVLAGDMIVATGSMDTDGDLVVGTITP